MASYLLWKSMIINCLVGQDYSQAGTVNCLVAQVLDLGWTKWSAYVTFCNDLASYGMRDMLCPTHPQGCNTSVVVNTEVPLPCFCMEKCP